MSFRRRTSETIADLQRQLAALTTEVKESQSTAPPPPPPVLGSAEAALAPPGPGTSLADIHDLVTHLGDRVDGLDARQLGDHERLSLRLDELTVLFSNQLLEMSHELDDGHRHVTSRLAAQEQRLEELAATAHGRDESGTSAALVEELRANQVRIANDLARHEIAVRQDLAALAELVNRSRRSPT